MKQIFAKHIKAHIRQDIQRDPELYGDFDRFLRGFTVESWKLREVCENAQLSQGLTGQLLKFDVVTAYRAKKYENNRVRWTVGICQNDDAYVFFDGTFWAE